MNILELIVPKSGRCGLLLVVPLVLLAPSACNPFGPDFERVEIEIDSIVAPDAAPSIEPLTVTFHGLIGGTSCASLERVERTRIEGALEVRFHGKRRTGGTCLQAPSILEYEETIEPPIEGPFIIRVLQPDTLEKVVQIDG